MPNLNQVEFRPLAWAVKWFAPSPTHPSPPTFIFHLYAINSSRSQIWYSMTAGVWVGTGCKVACKCTKTADRPRQIQHCMILTNWIHKVASDECSADVALLLRSGDLPELWAGSSWPNTRLKCIAKTMEACVEIDVVLFEPIFFI